MMLLGWMVDTPCELIIFMGLTAPAVCWAASEIGDRKGDDSVILLKALGEGSSLALNGGKRMFNSSRRGMFGLSG